MWTRVSEALRAAGCFLLSFSSFWPAAQPGGAEPAPLRRHDGAGRGRPLVLRAGQGHGSAAQLPRLRLLPQAGPGPRGLSGISGNFADNQSQGQRNSVAALKLFPPGTQPWFSFLGRRDVPELAVRI